MHIVELVPRAGSCVRRPSDRDKHGDMPASPIVRVTFVDAADGTTLGVVEMRASLLPASFAVATTLHLGDDDWEVVRADPTESADFIARGSLMLELRIVPPKPVTAKSTDPKSVLFSVPSVVEAIPTASAPRPEKSVLALHEDDWRQIEMVHLSEIDNVASQIAQIETIVRDSEGSVGFHTCHARGTPVSPLASASLDLAALRALFEIAVEYSAIAWVDAAHAIHDGYGFRTRSGLTVYGLAHDGRVSVLALQPDRNGPASRGDATALGALRNHYGLMLVDWCARVVVQPTRN